MGKRVPPTAEILVFLYSEASFCPASFKFSLSYQGSFNRGKFVVK